MQAEKVTYHEFSDELDSTDAFEGPEKTLRLIFEQPSTRTGLLEIPRSEWEAMLDVVKCKVLSVVVHPCVHAYVLSESSLFVYCDHILLKTCGTTTLLEGLPKILDTVEAFADVAGLAVAKPRAAFYSRRSFFNPEKQPRPHGCWDDEVHRLKQVFPDPRFTGYFGANRDERWHLFSYDRVQHDASNDRPQQALKSSSNRGWIELMMTGIDTELAKGFHRQESLEDSVMSLDSVNSVLSLASNVGADPDDNDPGHFRGNVMTRATAIDDLFVTDRQLIDSFAFSPCGYSCNGILLDSGEYMTIHVTPQSGFSYASFETNVLHPETVESGLTHQRLIDRVLKVFEPKKLTLAICTAEKIVLDPRALSSGSYLCTAETGSDFGNTNLVHYILEKKP